jgi:hypothetical protein
VFKWIKKTVFAFASVSVFFGSTALADFVVRPYPTYHGYTGEEVRVEWDFNGNAVFEAQIINHDLDETINVTPTPTSDRFITFTLPRSGHYSVWVRAVKDGVAGPWAKSWTAEDAQYNGNARGWWLYAGVAPTGSITIE